VAAAPGVTITIDLRVSRQLPTTVDAAAYRIIQEAVTNIVKHSDAANAAIMVRDHGDMLEIEVSDDGRPQDHPDAGSGGHGIDGMRERATALGGTLEAGPHGEGFRVRATLPVEEMP
jgi:signal transduction histidine kinase